MTRPISIIHVEDDEVDVIALRRALAAQRIANVVYNAYDGIEALAMLRGTEPVPEPYLILLDLNLPRMDGFEFLSALRDDPALHGAVVFVLTTSRADEDVLRAYDLNVAGYLVKSDLGTGFADSVSLLGAYWRTVALPAPPGAGPGPVRLRHAGRR